MQRLMQTARWAWVAAIGATLSACGGGSGGGDVQSTPAPPAAAAAPPPAPVPRVDYDTSEYRASNGPVTHNAIAAYGEGASGAGVTVGVIDTGISDPTGALAGRISSASRDFSGSGSITDISGHGTAVSMILAAGRDGRDTLGMAWGAQIMALRTDEPGSCNAGTSAACRHPTNLIAGALDHAVANGARVVDISLGGSAATQDLRAAVSRATAAGTIIVISAGNDGEAAPDALAASIADPVVGRGLVIIATALNSLDLRASFSNGALGFEGSTIAALGVGVRTLDASGNPVGFSGTSASAPVVAGAVALLRQAFPTLSPAQIVRLLLDSARDIGTSGIDSIYGAGMLDLARAFAPQGTLSLAGTAVPLETVGVGQLSSAMGDAATGQGVEAVTIDSLGRAYRVDLSPAMRRTAPRLTLAPAIGQIQQAASLSRGNAAVSLSFTGGRALSDDERTALRPDARPHARLLTARMMARVAPGASVAIGLASGASSLDAMLDRGASAAFLTAGADTVLTPEFRADSAVAVRQALGSGLVLGLHAEQGRVVGDSLRDPLRTETAARDGGYRLAGASLSGRSGPARLTIGIDHLAEGATALGARFDPLFGAQSAETVMAGGALSLERGGWTLGGAYRHGWTRAAAGGLLDRGGRLRSAAWSVEAIGSALLRSGDRFALRHARPLRVEASDFALTVPTGYDYATGAATMGRRPLDLTPRGRESVTEIVYATPAAGGWLTANLYRRLESGHGADAPDDLGLALRFEAAF